MNRSLVSMTLGLTLTLAMSVSASAADPSSGPASKEPVYVDGAALLYQGADPVQVSLLVHGNLPTPCHTPAWAVSSGDATIAVSLWSEAGEGMCVAVLEPFELTIPLDEAVAGAPVELDGEPVGVVADPAGLGAIGGLAGAGTFFGMCLGTCVRDLSADGAALVLRGFEHMLAEPVFASHGELTAAGQAAVEAALAVIEPAGLEAVYGCPDCADGGAAWVRLMREGGAVSEHVMEFGEPPADLAQLYELTAGLLDSLGTCRSSELVAVAADCEPSEDAPAAS